MNIYQNLLNNIKQADTSQDLGAANMDGMMIFILIVPMN
jgi:hypothetical protein